MGLLDDEWQTIAVGELKCNMGRSELLAGNRFKGSGVEYAAAYAGQLLCGKDKQFDEMFCVLKRHFIYLVKWPRERNLVRDTQVPNDGAQCDAMKLSLRILGQGPTQITTCDGFQVDGSTVSVIFNNALAAIFCLHEKVVVQPGADHASPEIEPTDYCSYFTGCIGVVDCIPIEAHLPQQRAKTLIGRTRSVSLYLWQFDSTELFGYFLATVESFIGNAALMC
ncbi:hypothetical protein CcaCcLH18_12367 [Colletotrichum camelliae]|nr:hypothetical protein CcaCcLH18_12367 [Colletotrichum camelliae]